MKVQTATVLTREQLACSTSMVVADHFLPPMHVGTQQLLDASTFHPRPYNAESVAVLLFFSFPPPPSSSSLPMISPPLLRPCPIHLIASLALTLRVFYAS